MAVIDPDGLFNGERFERVSDAARYAWPYLWAASNRCGRIELNYRLIIGKAFSRFRRAPTEEEFWGWIREFQQAYLLFVYEVDGAYWGQWDTSEKFLATYKLAADLASPKPDSGAWNAWREEYIRSKKERNSTKPITVTNFKNVLKTSETFSHGNGNGNGNGSLKTCSTDVERPVSQSIPFDTLDELDTTPKPTWGKTEKLRAFADSFWPAWPRKVAKAAAEKAWLKHASTPELADKIVRAARDQGPQLTKNGLEYCPYPATWLNDRRFEDEPVTPDSVEPEIQRYVL